jgi:hypothetical protein
MTTKKLPNGKTVDVVKLRELLKMARPKKIRLDILSVKESHRSGLTKKHFSTHDAELPLVDSSGFVIDGLPAILKAQEKDEKTVLGIVCGEEEISRCVVESKGI